jgi:hypothetical protein
LTQGFNDLFADDGVINAGQNSYRGRSTLLHQRGSALPDFLEHHFKATKLLRA